MPVATVPVAAPGAAHRRRLREVWRSAGWPFQDLLEAELLAAGWLARDRDALGRDTVRVTDAGVAALAESLQRNRAARDAHEQLVERIVREMQRAGRLAWRGLSLRAWVGTPASAEGRGDGGEAPSPQPPAGPHAQGPVPPEDLHAWAAARRAADLVRARSRRPVLPQPGLLDAGESAAQPGDPPAADGGWVNPPTAEGGWVMAMPDVFSIRQTSVEAYLLPVAHEIKVHRADLLSDLRRPAKGEAYRWLASECWYVIREGIAQPQEIPEVYGVLIAPPSGPLQVARPAPQRPMRLPFAVWMALARATPEPPDELAQALLQPGGTAPDGPGRGGTWPPAPDHRHPTGPPTSPPDRPS